MNHEPYGPPAAIARPSRVRTTALSTAVPIALAIGAVFAAPIATGVPDGTPDRPHRSVHRADGLRLANGANPARIGRGLGRCRRRQVA